MTWLMLVETVVVPVAIAVFALVGARIARTLKELAHKQEGMVSVTQAEFREAIDAQKRANEELQSGLRSFRTEMDDRMRYLQERMGANSEALHQVESGFLQLATSLVQGSREGARVEHRQ